MLAVILVVWMERNKRTFETYGGAELEELWERIKFWASLWASNLGSLNITLFPLLF